jgi:hypothetical protein
MLMSTGNLVVSSLLWLTWEHPDVPQAAALAVLLVAMLMGTVLVVRQFVLRRLEHGAHAL